jgi:hypothetical protein
MHLIDGGVGVTTYESAVIDRRINQVVRVEGWNRVYIERELYFNFEDFFNIPGLRFGSGKLYLTVNAIIQFSFTTPFLRVGVMRIYFNGYKLYEGEVKNGSLVFDLKGEWASRENFVRVEVESTFGTYIRLEVSNCRLVYNIYYPSVQRSAVEDANRNTIEKNRQYLSGVVSSPSPNTTVIPTSGGGDWVTGFVQFAQMMPQLLVFVILIMVFIEIVRIFRR